MTDHLKGLLITFTGVLFILPDSLFVRLIGTDGVTVAFWKALLIGLVLGPIAEVSLRQGLILADYDMMALVTRPIAGTLLLLSALSLAYGIWGQLRRPPSDGPGNAQPETS